MSTTVTIGQNSTDTFSGCEDTDVRDNGGAINSNFATDTPCYVSKFASGDYRTNLIKFPGLSNIAPGTVTVTAATLYYKIAGGAVDPITITLRRILRNWIVNQATGNVYSTGNSWTSVMGVSNGNDRSSTVSAAVSTDLTSGYHAFTSAQMIIDVQNMIDVPSTNYGWGQERTDAADDGGYRFFPSSDGSDGDRPYLSVTYTTGGGAAPRHRMLLLGVG